MEREATAALTRTAIKTGFRAIDTANQPRHYDEPLVGVALEQLQAEGIGRDALFVQTKFTPLDGHDHRVPYDAEADLTTQVRQSFESSLRNLKTERVDSYLDDRSTQRWPPSVERITPFLVPATMTPVGQHQHVPRLANQMTIRNYERGFASTARVVGSYNTGNWVGRWLYNGLHSLDFPFLYNHRPLWDIVVILFMLGGTALCVTSLVLAWRVVGRTLVRVVSRSPARERSAYAPQPAARRSI